MTIRFLFFDLDDTLLETHEAHGKSMARAALHAEASTDAPADRIREAADLAGERLEKLLERGMLNARTQPEYRLMVWQEAFRSLDLPEEAAARCAQIYLDGRRSAYRLYADVTEILPQFAPARHLSLVTNGLADFQREKIDAVGVARWMQAVTVSGELGIWKPDRGIFEHALKQAGCTDPAQAMMVGDSLTKDIAGAAALGMRTAWMRRYPHLSARPDVAPDLTVANLNELAEQLERF